MSSNRLAVLTARTIFLVAIAVLLSTRTFVGFDRLRIKLIQVSTTPQDGLLRIATSDLEPFTKFNQPLALIVRAANHGVDASRLVISVDDVEVGNLSIAPGSARRIDCIVERWARASGPHEIVIAGPATGWQVEYVELATHHGNTSGVAYLVILPRGSTGYSPPAAPWIVAFCLVIVGLLLIPEAPIPAQARFVHRFAAGVIFVLFTVIQIAPWLSPFKIVMSIGTLTGWLAVVLIPRLLTAWRWLSAARDWSSDRLIILARALAVGVTVLAAFATVMTVQLRDSYNGNYSGFLLVSERLFDANPLLRNRDDVRSNLVLRTDGGYDGQFAYFAAFDPLMRAFRNDPIQYRSVVDAVPYRYGRIGFSLLVRLFAGNRWRRYPATMMGLILAALFVSAFVLATLAQLGGLSAATGLLILFIPGFWQSLQDGLPEPIAAATIVVGCYFVWQRKWNVGAGCFALSLLVRETGIVFVACIAAGVALSGRRREALTLFVISVAPVILWRLYVGSILFPDWGFKGFLDSPADFGWPFMGFVDLSRVIASGEYYGGAADFTRAGLSYPLLLVAAFALASMLVWKAPSAVNVAAFIYAVMAVCLNYVMIWVHVSNAQRGTFEVFVALALSALASRSYPRALQLATSGFWCAAAAYATFGAFDAGSLRAALGLPF